MGVGPTNNRPKQRIRWREMWAAGSSPGFRDLARSLARRPWLPLEAGLLHLLGRHQSEGNVGRPCKSGVPPLLACKGALLPSNPPQPIYGHVSNGGSLRPEMNACLCLVGPGRDSGQMTSSPVDRSPEPCLLTPGVMMVVAGMHRLPGGAAMGTGDSFENPSRPHVIMAPVCLLAGIVCVGLACCTGTSATQQTTTAAAAQTTGGGLVPVSVGGKWGYIDQTGKMVIKPKYQQADPFSQGLAAVSPDDDTILYIDHSRKVVWNAPVPTTTSTPTEPARPQR